LLSAIIASGNYSYGNSDIPELRSHRTRRVSPPTRLLIRKSLLRAQPGGPTFLMVSVPAEPFASGAEGVLLSHPDVEDQRGRFVVRCPPDRL